MSKYQDLSESKIDDFRSLFISRLEASSEIFEDNVFRIKDAKGRLKLSQPLFDAVMVAVDQEYASVSNFISKRKKIQKKLFEALKDEENFKLITGKIGTAPSIRKRAEFIRNLMLNV